MYVRRCARLFAYEHERVGSAPRRRGAGGPPLQLGGSPGNLTRILEETTALHSERRRSILSSSCRPTRPDRRSAARGIPAEVFTHDFPSLGVGKAIPYGTYDLAQDRAVVNVGVTHDTAEFAVESIRRWWRLMGKRAYPDARRLLISADAGGSNGNRLRAWKMHLQRLADELSVPITACHYPPGTSKRNAIEHRLFAFISMNWKGQPLVSWETVINLVGRTRTRSGLVVKAVLDTRDYETGQEVTSPQFHSLHLKRHSFHPDWNTTAEVALPEVMLCQRNTTICNYYCLTGPKTAHTGGTARGACSPPQPAAALHARHSPSS